MTPPPTVRPRRALTMTSRALTMTSRALLRMTSQALLMVRQTKGGGGDDSGDARRAGPARRHRDRHRLLGADRRGDRDRKSTRLNSSHVAISYAVFCLKK